MPTVFLDRDGVINRNRPSGDYVKSWQEFEFLPGSLRAIARLTHAGFRLLVITNQACIGKGIVTWDTVQQIHELLMQEVARAGGRIEAVLCCPHTPDDSCCCRKPAPGLLRLAEEKYKIDLRQSILVGDSVNDIQTAAAVGMPAIMVLSGLGRNSDLESVPVACRLGLNLAHAAQMILNETIFASNEQAALPGVIQLAELENLAR